LDIDVQGAEKIHNNDIDCNYVFIDAPSFEALEDRLKKRGTETPEVIQKRLNNAKKEIEKGKELSFYKHLVNDNLNNCYEAVATLIDEVYKISIKR
jgi:guanylate kinase